MTDERQRPYASAIGVHFEVFVNGKWFEGRADKSLIKVSCTEFRLVREEITEQGRIGYGLSETTEDSSRPEVVAAAKQMIADHREEFEAVVRLIPERWDDWFDGQVRDFDWAASWSYAKDHEERIDPGVTLVRGPVLQKNRTEIALWWSMNGREIEFCANVNGCMGIPAVYQTNRDETDRVSTSGMGWIMFHRDEIEALVRATPVGSE